MTDPKEASIELHRQRKSKGEDLVLRDTTYRGHRRLDLRVDWINKDGIAKMTRKGIRLSLEQWCSLLPALQAVIRQLTDPDSEIFSNRIEVNT